MKFRIATILLCLMLSPTLGWAEVDFVTDDLLNLGSSGSWESDSSGTVCALVNPDNLLSVDGTMQIFGHGGDNTALPGGLLLSIRRRSANFTGNRFDITQLFESSGNGAGWYGSTSLSADTNYYVCFVSSGTQWSIYVNGVAETLSSWVDGGSEGNDGDWYADSVPTNSVTYIGAVKFDGVNAGYFDGDITEVSVWSSALTGEQISNLYNSRSRRMPCQTSPSTLRVSLAIDECVDGASCDGLVFSSVCGGNTDSATGDNGANNTGLTGKAGSVLTYP